MQLKLNSGSFTEQVDCSNIAWSHCARAWVKYSQADKKVTCRIVIGTSWFLEALLGGFPIKYLPSFTLITVKGAWKGHAELCLEVFSIVLCHPTTFYIHLLGICSTEVQAAFSDHTGNILFWLQYISKFWSTFFCNDRFFGFCSHTLLCSVLESWFLYS